MPNGGISPPGPGVRAGRGLPGLSDWSPAACRYLPTWTEEQPGRDLDGGPGRKKDEGRSRPPRARHVAERSRRRNPGQLIQFWRAPDVRSGIMREKRKKKRETPREGGGAEERKRRDNGERETHKGRRGQERGDGGAGEEGEGEKRASRKGTKRKKEGGSLRAFGAPPLPSSSWSWSSS